MFMVELCLGPAIPLLCLLLGERGIGFAVARWSKAPQDWRGLSTTVWDHDSLTLPVLMSITTVTVLP